MAMRLFLYLYLFFALYGFEERLPAQGRMYAADENLEQIDSMYFPIIKILREEIRNRKYEYTVDNNDRKIDIYYNGQLVKSHSQEQFTSEADYLYD